MQDEQGKAETGVAGTHQPGDADSSPMLESGKRFKEYVREAMNDQGITMAALSRESGIERTVIYSWFRGQKRPRKTTLRPVGDVLKLTPDQLLAVWDGDKPHKAHRATETVDPLVTALAAQTAAIERLVAVLEGDLPGRVAALEPVVSRLAERALAGSPELPLPRETTR